MRNKRYFGFYWTLPLPRYDFRTLPENVDAAAEVSRTIRYQRDRVRRWVKEEKGELVAEEVFLELEPDRGSQEMAEAVDGVLKRCRAKDATLVMVKFDLVHGRRRHHHLWDKLETSGDYVDVLDPAPIPIDGQEFDPIEHFRAWDQVNHAFTGSKAERTAVLIETILQLKENYPTNEALAEALNSEGFKTLTSIPWTDENLRKFRKKHSLE